VFDDAGLAEGVKALGDSGSVYQVSVTDFAGYHLVQLPELAPAVQRVHPDQPCCTTSLQPSVLFPCSLKVWLKKMRNTVWQIQRFAQF
jgi:hypothetical protein